MKLSVLNWGIGATHEVIEVFEGLGGSRSISDYDAFVFDPAVQTNLQVPHSVFQRRQNEIRDLVDRKGGIVICLLRPDRVISPNTLGDTGRYGLLARAASNVAQLVSEKIRDGESTRWNLRRGVSGAALEYFQVLQKEVRMESFLDAPISQVETFGGKVFAENSANYPVCVEFVVGVGRLCFVPVPTSVATDRVGAAIKRVVEAHFGGPSEIVAPPWVERIAVPGADSNGSVIAELAVAKTALEARISGLEKERDELLEYRSLLFGYGKSMLEPVVRRALHQIGFEVPERWTGDWDFELREPASGSTAIGEVEGTDGPVDVNKYRQLLDYFQTEVLEGRLHKAILAGNGHRTRELGATERQNQFTEHVLRGARQNGFCLLPTSELFKAVCAVLGSPLDEALKVSIRRSILATVGVWTFNREVTASSSPAPPAVTGEADGASG